MSPSEANTPSSPSEPAGSECSLSYYKTQYEQLEAELADFQSSSRELEAELERDVEAAEKRERHLQEKVENLGFEVNEWKTKYKQSKAEANAAQNALQKEITAMRETNRQLQMKLRDIEVANDDFERQARNTTSSLDDLESKYNVAIERGVLMEEEMRLGEQEREALRIETQRLRDELSDLKVEVEIKSEKLRHAEAAGERQRLRKPSPLDSMVGRPRSLTSENSPTTTASSPTIATPPTKSASSIVSETPTPPSPPTSETSLPVMSGTPAVPVSKSRLSMTNSTNTARPITQLSRTSRHSRRPSIPLSNIRSTPSMPRRTTTTHQEHPHDPPGTAASGSLHQIRGLIGKMQKLEQRVNSARSKLPAPTSTPPRASPRNASAVGQSYIPPTVTMRSNRKRTGGSDGASAVHGTPDHRPSSRLSFGIAQPNLSRDHHSVSRPASRASISSRTSTSQLPSAAPSTGTRPGSRQSLSRAPTPLGRYGSNTFSDSRRPRSSVGGSYSALHQGGGHGHSASVSRLSHHHAPFRDEVEPSMDVRTPTPARMTGLPRAEVDSGIPGLLWGATKVDGAGDGRRTSAGPGVRVREDGDMGPPERKRLSGVGETF